VRISNATLQKVANLRHRGWTVPEIAREMATDRDGIERALRLLEEQKHRSAGPGTQSSSGGEAPVDIRQSMLFLSQHDPRFPA
jgi:hypothetical protein